MRPCLSVLLLEMIMKVKKVFPAEIADEELLMVKIKWRLLGFVHATWGPLAAGDYRAAWPCKDLGSVDGDVIMDIAADRYTPPMSQYLYVPAWKKWVRTGFRLPGDGPETWRGGRSITNIKARAVKDKG